MTILNLLLLAGEALLASIVLPLLAGLLARAYPHSAGRRSLVWAVMFAVLLALPLAIFAPTLAVIALPAPPAAPAMAVSVAVEPTSAPASTGFSGAAGAILIALFAWGLGALWIVARGLAGLVWLQKLRFCSAPIPPERLPLPLGGRCSVRLSPDCVGPITWGAVRPVILLPDDAPAWPRERLEAALRHELAHVVRRDSLIQAMAMLACALYWPNPLVWRAANALRREAESAADDAVIAGGVRPSDYASLLVDLASEWPSQRPPAFEMAMASPPLLTERVQSILSPNAMRTGATAMDTFKLALVGGTALAALALARPSVAEVAAPAPAANPAAQPVELRSVAARATQHVEPRSAESAGKSASAVSRAQAGTQSAQSEAPARNIQLAVQDVEAVLPDARIDTQALPPAPPSPPAPAAAPASPAVAAPPARPLGPDTTFSVHVDRPFNFRYRVNGKDGKPMTPEERAALERDLAKIGPAIDKAMADAHIADIVQKELSASDAKTREMVAKQLAEIGPRIQRAIAGAHIQALITAHLADIQPEIDAAMAKARENRQRALERSAQAEERAAARLEEEAKRARERAKRQREEFQAQPPKN